jgi:hypothetical protein
MNIHRHTARGSVIRLVGAGALACFLLLLGPLGMAGAGADTTLLGYDASTLAVGAQFGFNVPGVVPLPQENLVEEDVPFARINLGDGPVVDAIGAPYYPGDVAANIGTLLQTFGFPLPLPNDTALAESKYPVSPGYTSSASFGVNPATATAASPSVFYASATSSSGGGTSTGTLSDLALNHVDVTKTLPIIGGLSSSGSLVDVGNISASDNVTLGSGSITDTASTSVKSVDIAGLIDIAGITSTASATSDGTTGTPLAKFNVGQVTVNGEAAYIDGTGVHIPTTDSTSAGVTPAQLQQTVNASLGQDGITITLLNPTLTNSAGQASANAGGLEISLAHQLDVPFVPGEPNVPIPELGNEGLPAGEYTITTNITIGLAQASVSATGLASQVSVLPTATTTPTTAFAPTPSTSGSFGTTTGNSGFSPITGNSGFSTGASTESLAPTGAGTSQGAAAPTSVQSLSTAFPVRGLPAPVGWTVAALLGCFILCYPLLLLARYQFIPRGRR